MKIKSPLIMLMVVLLSVAALSDNFIIDRASLINESYHEVGTSDLNRVELSKVSGNIWIHTTYSNYNGSRTPSNGIVAVTSEGIILVDTPWSNEQTEMLISMVSNVFNKDIKDAVITHTHEDRIGGIDALLNKGVDVRSTMRTASEAERLGYQKPKPLLDSEPILSLGDFKAEVFFPGEGHTADNVTVWFQEEKVLFGGCLIKSIDATDSEIVEDANLEEWSKSVLNIMDRYADAVIIIPGHGKWGNSDLLGNTWKLLSE